MTSMTRFACALALVLPLAACSGIVGPPPAGQIYRLHPQAFAAGTGARAGWQLSVAPPLAPQSLDTSRIALLHSPTLMDYYANAAWNDRAPVMVQSLLLEAFEASGRIGAVGREDSGLRTDYLLQSELRDFEAQYDVPDAAPRIVVKLLLRLVKIPERNVVGTTLISREAQASANSLPAVADAFSEATGAAVKEAVDWTLAVPAPAEPPAPPAHRRRGSR